MKRKEYRLKGYILTPSALYRMSILYGIHFRVVHKDGKKMTRQEQVLRTALYCFEHRIKMPIKGFHDDAFIVEYRKKEGWVNLEVELEDAEQKIDIFCYLFFNDSDCFSLDMSQATKEGKTGNQVFDPEKYADMLCAINSSASHDVEWYKAKHGPLCVDDDLI